MSRNAILLASVCGALAFPASANDAAGIDVLMELCDRIMVMCSGHVNGILDGRTATKEEVGLRMTQLKGKGDAE